MILNLIIAVVSINIIIILTWSVSAKASRRLGLLRKESSQRWTQRP